MSDSFFDPFRDSEVLQEKAEAENAQTTLNQGGYSNSDQMIDDAKVGLKIFDNFHPSYEEAKNLVGQGGYGGSPGGGYGGASGPMGPGGGMGGATYNHSGIDPNSLRAGMDEFRGIDFSAFHSDAEVLKKASGTVDDSTDELHDAWDKAADDWTGEAKESAQQRKNSLTDGAGDLQQALKIAPDSITKIIDDGICRGVADFCHEVLRLYGDGTINGMTLASVEIAISAVRDIPSKIEEIKEQKDSGSGILSFINPFTGMIVDKIADDAIEQLQSDLEDAKRRLRRFCQTYEEKAGCVHRQARTQVNAIQQAYGALIDSLNKQLDPPPFEESEGQSDDKEMDESDGKGNKPGTASGMVSGTAGGAGIGGGVSGGVESGGSPNSSTVDTEGMATEEAQEPEKGEQDSETNPVTGGGLEKDPETGEPYPIDPETGEAIKDVDGEPETVTVEHGDNEIQMRAPDSDGEMTISLDDGSGDPKEFQLDFQPDDGSGDSTGSSEGRDRAERQPDEGQQAERVRGDQDAVQQNGDGDTNSDSGQRVYWPGDDGRIHIDKDGIEITAAQPDGPDGPTVVEIDDGSGEPTTYTLGGQDGQDAGSFAFDGADPDRMMDGSVSSSAAEDSAFDGADDTDSVSDTGGEQRPADSAEAGDDVAEGTGDQGHQDSSDESTQGQTASNSAEDSRHAESAEPATGDQEGAAPSSSDGGVDTADTAGEAQESEDGDSGADSADPDDTSTGTSAQGWLGDVFGDDVGLDASLNDSEDPGAADTGTVPEGASDQEAGSAQLGAAPGADSSSGTDGESGGSGRGMPMMGGAGGGAGSGGGGEEYGTNEYSIVEQLFGSSDEVSRISGSLDDTIGGYQFGRTERS